MKNIEERVRVWFAALNSDLDVDIFEEPLATHAFQYLLICIDDGALCSFLKNETSETVLSTIGKLFDLTSSFGNLEIK